MNEFNEWLAANGWDPETVSANQKAKLQAAWRAETNANAAPVSRVTPEPVPMNVGSQPSAYEVEMEKLKADSARRDAIKATALKYSKLNEGNTEKLARFQAMCDAACASPNVHPRDFELDMLRADRSAGPLIMASSTPQLSEKVVEAAFARRAGLSSLEKDYDERTLEASDSQFRHGLGIQDLLGLGAKQNGWRGHSVKAALTSRDFMMRAFGTGGDGFDLRAGGAVQSTYSIPNVISNVANKFVQNGFLGVDSTWSRISSRRSVSDFKQVTSIGLTGHLQYQKLAPGGEIRHGSIGEVVYTNQAATYAEMLGISRNDLINDDAGVLASVSTRFGRGAALKVNDVFWTVFLNNSSFFAAGNNNVSTGGGSALGTADGAAINAAEVKFMNQTDPDSKPLGVMPSILLAPPTLANTARRWMGSFGFTQGGTSGLGDANIYQGRYRVESSPYMENSSYTGYSTAAWYLLADPSTLSAIEGVFLNGKDTPTVETAELDFSLLGVAWRGYIDFGFALQEYRAGVRSAGS